MFYSSSFIKYHWKIALFCIALRGKINVESRFCSWLFKSSETNQGTEIALLSGKTQYAYMPLLAIIIEKHLLLMDCQN